MEESEKFSRRDWDSMSVSLVGESPVLAVVEEKRELRLMLLEDGLGCCCCCFWSACHWPKDDIVLLVG